MKHRCPCCRWFYRNETRDNPPMTSMTGVPSTYDTPKDSPYTLKKTEVNTTNEYELLDYTVQNGVGAPCESADKKGYVPMMQNGHETQ